MHDSIARLCHVPEDIALLTKAVLKTIDDRERITTDHLHNHVEISPKPAKNQRKVDLNQSQVDDNRKPLKIDRKSMENRTCMSISSMVAEG